jgi:hypothetical protein
VTGLDRVTGPPVAAAPRPAPAGPAAERRPGAPGGAPAQPAAAGPSPARATGAPDPTGVSGRLIDVFV